MLTSLTGIEVGVVGLPLQRQALDVTKVVADNPCNQSATRAVRCMWACVKWSPPTAPMMAYTRTRRRLSTSVVDPCHLSGQHVCALATGTTLSVQTFLFARRVVVVVITQ